MCQLFRTAFLFFLFSGLSWAQDLSTASPSTTAVKSASTAPASRSTATIDTISLIVTKGTPLQVALDQEIRVREVGQRVHGRVVQPVYAVDQQVVPLATEVTGIITRIEGVSAKTRTLSILNADFTPARKIDIEFNELIFADGKHVPSTQRLCQDLDKSFSWSAREKRKRRTVQKVECHRK